MRWVFRKIISFGFGDTLSCKAPKRKSTYIAMMMMSFPIGSETESSPAACKKIECVFTPLLLFDDLKRKLSAFFLPDEFSQKDLFVRVERLLVFGKREREREREKVASARQSKTKKRSSSSSKIDLIKKVPRITTNVRLCKKRDGSRWWSAITAGWFPLGTRTFRCLLLRPWLMMMMMVMVL